MKPKLILKRTIANIAHARNKIAPPSKKTKALRVLCYHSITDKFVPAEYGQMTTPRRLFEEQLGYLREEHYSVLSPGDAIGALAGRIPMPERAVLITFDDGFRDNFTNALPALERFGFKAAVFVTVDFVGKDPQYLDWGEVLSLSRSKAVTIGSHSLSHARLAVLGQDDLEKETSLSKKILEDKLGKAVDLFAYPYGSYGSFDRRAADALKLSGYKAAFTTVAGSNGPACDMYAIKRTRISWYDDPREFAKELAGSYDRYSIWQKVSTAL